MSQSIQVRQETDQLHERRYADRRLMSHLHHDQLKRIGVQVAEHFMREDKEGAWQLMQTYNLSAQGYYQLMAFALQRLNTYGGNASTHFINWMTSLHTK